MGASPARLSPNCRMLDTRTARTGLPSRTPMTAAARALLITKYVRPAPTTANRDRTVGSKRCGIAWLSKAPAITAGIAIDAWLYRVPYHGMPPGRPRSPLISRASIVPSSPTTAAAVGPPSTAAAKIGAIVTSTIAPPVIRTGAAALRALKATQRQRPTTPPISGRKGTVATTTTQTTVAAKTTSSTRAFSPKLLRSPSDMRTNTSMEARVAPPYWALGTTYCDRA